MSKMKQERFVDFLSCASVLEERTYVLYKNIADSVNLPLIKPMLLHIAHDSRKHSAILKGISESIGKPKKNANSCESYLKGAWAIIESLSKETVGDLTLKESFDSLSKKLIKLESTLAEEYFVLVELKTLQYMTKEIRQSYDIELKDLKKTLGSIVKDEEIHGELLAKMEKILESKKERIEDKTPIIRYMNPDTWSKALPRSA
jgi:rubrerythrin